MYHFYIREILGIPLKDQREIALRTIKKENLNFKDTYPPYVDTNIDRTRFKDMINNLSDSDTIYIYELLILASDLKELISVLLKFKEKKIKLRILNSGKIIDFADEAGSAYIDTLKDCENFLRGISNEKRLKGIKKAKESGKYKGKKKIEIPDFARYYKDYMSRKISKPKLAKELKISRGTLDRLFKEYEEKSNKEKNIPIVPLQEGSKIGQFRFDDIDMSLKEER